MNLNACKHGHELTPDNTYTSPKGEISCRTCRRSAKAHSRARLARGEQLHRPGYCAQDLHDLNDPANRRKGRGGCRPCREARRQAQRDTLRDEVTAAYGGKCAECGKPGRLGFGTPDALHLDHIDGGGGIERERVLGRANAAGPNFYAWVVSQGFPSHLQLLCEPCHLDKTARESAARQAVRA